VSYNKFLAKLASDQNKPDGLCVITPAKGAAFVASLPVSRFYGVGPKTAAKMERLGIVTGADLAARDLPFLERHFGSSGPTYYRLARGICDRQVRPDRERKSIGAEDTFMEDLTDPARMAEELERISHTIWSRIGDRGIEGRTVVLKMKYQDFRIVTRTHSLPRPVAGREEFCDIGRTLLSRLVPVAKPVRLLGLTLSGLCNDAPPAELEPSLPL
jgi:DNA polymerase IV